MFGSFAEILVMLRDKAGFMKQGKFKSASEICNSVGSKLRTKGLYEDALAFHQEERELSEMCGVVLDIAVAERHIGEVLFDMERFDEALEHHRAYVGKARESGNRLEMARATYTLGRSCHQRSMFDQGLSETDVSKLQEKAEDCFKESLDTLEVCRVRGEKEFDVDSMKGRTVMNLGLIRESKQDFESAISYFTKALQIFLRYENSESKEVQGDLFRAFRNMAGAKEKQCRYEEAISFARKAVSCAEKSKDYDDLIDTNLFICGCHFRLGDFRISKKLLLRSRIIAKESNLETRLGDIDQTLKKVIRIRRLQSTLEEEKESDLEEKSGQYEELGDLLVSREIASFATGLNAYTSCLQLKLKNGMSSKDPRLGPIYVSIADTYKDLGELDKVVEYYEREIECHPNDEKETARSYLAIADAEADMKKDFGAVDDHYQVAYTKAVIASNYLLAKHVLRCRLEYAKGAVPLEVGEMEKEYRDFCSTYNLDPEAIDDLDSASSQVSKPSVSSDMDLSDLSSDDEVLESSVASDDENASKSRGRNLRARRVCVSAISKKDERGETPLHRAAREGNMKKVKTLLMGGADVNAYDNGGWTPLHEAALAGEIEVVDYLLRHGADMTKTGVEVFKYVTEGMTALHDAALGGHIEVMALMIAKGADILTRTEKGETPLDYLRNWRLSRERSGEITDGERVQVLEYEEKLLADMKKAGYKGSLKPARPSAVVAEGEDFEVKTVPDDIIEYDSENECDCGCADGGPCVRLREPQAAKAQGRLEYMEAIKGVRASAVLSEPSTSRGRISVSPPREVVRQISPVRFERKRRKTSESSVDSVERGVRPTKRTFECRNFVGGTSMRKGFMPELPDLIPLETKTKSFQKRAVQPKIDMVFDKSVHSESKAERRKSSGELSSPLRRDHERMLQRAVVDSRVQHGSSRVSTFVQNFARSNILSPVKSTPMPSVYSPAPSAVLSVIVQVDGKKFLIPVMENTASVGWLAEEAAKRFSSTDPAQRKPILAIEKEGGISLSASDYVTVLVKDGEQLLAVIQGWHSVSPFQKYKDFCSSQKSFTYSNIKKAMEELENTDVFRIPGSSMKANNLLPAIKAIETHGTIVEIDLTGHQLGDENLQVLVSSFRNMPSLRRLGLRGTGITLIGVKHLADLLESGSQGSRRNAPLLANLSHVDISSNPFGDIIGDILTVLIQHLHALDCLKIESCHLTHKLFDNSPELESSVRGSQLSRWFIGYNRWGRAGLEKWLPLLKGKQLRAVGVGGLCMESATIDSCTEENVCAFISGVFHGMAQVPVEELDLSECGIHTIPVVQSLNRLLVRTKNLRKLNLDKNSNLTFVELTSLLKNLLQKRCLLEELTFTGSEEIFPHRLFAQPPDGRNPIASVQDDQLRTFLELLAKFYTTETLVKVEFTLHPKVSEQWGGFLKGMWVTAKGNSGRVTQGERGRVVMVCTKL